MSDYQGKYPQPTNLGHSAYDADVPRSIDSDLDFIESQGNRIQYLNARVTRLEQLLRNREHSVKLFKEHSEYLETSRDTHVKTIEEKNKEIIRLENRTACIPELQAHIKGLETEKALKAKAKKKYLAKVNK